MGCYRVVFHIFCSFDLIVNREGLHNKYILESREEKAYVPRGYRSWE